MSIYMNPKRRTGVETLASVVFTWWKHLDDPDKLSNPVALLKEGLRGHSGRCHVARIHAAHRDLLDRGKSPPTDRKQLDA